MDCLIQAVQKEGLLSLCKGFVPSNLVYLAYFCRGSVDCLIQAVQKEGLLSLCKDFVPSNLVYLAYFCRGSVDCLIQAVQKEGLLSLYKGFVPCWLRNIISSSEPEFLVVLRKLKPAVK